jgi:hypothetical protein
MSKAKTASKNNPTKREKAKEFFFNGKKVKPVRLMMAGGDFMSGQYDDGSLVTNGAGGHLTWSDIVSANDEANA